MTSTTTHFSLPGLDTVGFRRWKAAAVELALTLDPAAPHGALGFLLDEEEFSVFTGETSFAPLELQTLQDDPSVRAAQKAFERQQVAKAQLRRAVFASVPEAVLVAVPGSHPDYGTAAVDLRVLLAFLRRRSTVSSHVLYEQVLLSLGEPFVFGTSFEDFLARHSSLHLECERVGFPLNQGDKLRFLVNGVGGHDGLFATSLAVWEENVAATPERRTFEDAGVLRERVPQAPPPREKGATKKSGKQELPRTATEVVAEACAAPAFEGLGTVLKRAALKLAHTAPATAATFGVHARKAEPPVAAAVTHRLGKQQDKWCWTHGPGAHASKDCRSPAPGHRNDASATNRLGGPAPRRGR